MLGSSCSPCCGPTPCTSQAIADFYDLMSSANVAIDVAGSSDERDGATIILDTFYLPDMPQQENRPVYVYSPTVSPVGQLEMALSPSESALEQFGPVSFHFAQVTYRYTNQNFSVFLELLMRPTFVGPFAFRESIPLLNTACLVSARLEIRQTAYTYLYNTLDVLDPADAILANLPGPAYGFWVTDYVNTLFNDAGLDVPFFLQGYEYPLPAAIAPRSSWSHTRNYFSAEAGQLVLAVDGTSLILSGNRSQTSTIYLPRFVDEQGSLPLFVDAQSKNQWYSNISVIQSPFYDEENVLRGWSISGSPSGKRFAASNMFASPVIAQHVFTSEQDAAYADITPTVRFSWE